MLQKEKKMDFRDFTYAQAIAQYKTISKAAEALYISQPSLSKFLQKLEERVGTPLFDRIEKQMYPTYAGEQFLKAGREIFRIQKQLDLSLQQIRHETAGQLRIATTAARGCYVLTEILPRFKRLYPGYHIEIMERSAEGVEQAVENGEADLAIYICVERNPIFQYFHIVMEEVALVLAGDSPYVEKAVRREGFKYPWLDLNWLKNEVMFVNDASQWYIGRISHQLMREAHIMPEITEFRSLETCLALASRGLGFTLTFDISVRCFKNYEQRPAYLSVGNKPNRAEFAIACRKNYRLKTAEKELVNMIKQKFGPPFSI